MLYKGLFVVNYYMNKIVGLGVDCIQPNIILKELKEMEKYAKSNRQPQGRNPTVHDKNVVTESLPRAPRRQPGFVPRSATCWVASASLVLTQAFGGSTDSASLSWPLGGVSPRQQAWPPGSDSPVSDKSVVTEVLVGGPRLHRGLTPGASMAPGMQLGNI